MKNGRLIESTACGVVSGCRVSRITNTSAGYPTEIKLKADGKVDGIGAVCRFAAYALKINIRFGAGPIVFRQSFNTDGIIGKDGETWPDTKGQYVVGRDLIFVIDFDFISRATEAESGLNEKGFVFADREVKAGKRAEKQVAIVRGCCILCWGRGCLRVL